jgi:hypothetical protein
MSYIKEMDDELIGQVLSRVLQNVASLIGDSKFGVEELETILDVELRLCYKSGYDAGYDTGWTDGYHDS